MSLNYKNYWLDTCAIPMGTPGDLPEQVDVAIIGAGFTGLSAALALSKRGARVAVLEANSIGWGASSRNGGMVLTGTKLTPQTLLERYGKELTQRIYAASLASIDYVEQIVQDESIDCNFSRSGHLEVASKPSHFDAFARRADLVTRIFNHKLRLIPRTELRGEIGSSQYYGGIVDEMSAGLNPARYVAGLCRATLRAGACIYEKTPVEHIARIDSRFEIDTSCGRLLAREVLIATGGYTSSLTPQLNKRIIPIGSFIIMTEQLSEQLAHEVIPRNRMIFDSKHYLHYYRLTPDNRLLFGGRAAFFPETSKTVDRSREILYGDMVEVYPQLRSLEVKYVWGGTLDFCFDTMPHAGSIDGLHYAAGYAGHGVAMATYLGAEVAKQICSESRENPFSEIPFPHAPLHLYNGRPWFLPFAGAYYKVLDWLS
jgi:glycine/D-amino acid oxidase-like deaminating enzyme